MIELIIASGGFNGIILWLLKFIKGKKSAQAQTAVLGILCFIDDYANAIIVGSMMRPVTDRFRVSREKLAFIVDATSAPITGLAVVSTWIATEVGLFAGVSQQLGFDKTGYSMFFDALSFRFYCLFMIMFVFVNIISGRDFGPMAKAQLPPADGDNAGVSLKVKGRAVNALVPLGGFLAFHFTGLWFDGGGRAELAAGGSLASWSYWQEVIGNSQNSTVVLACSALFGVLLALLCGLMSRSLRADAILRSFYSGIKRSVIPTCILLLAWSLKGCCDALYTGEFLTTILAGRVSPYVFPAILFLVASVTSFATGTSWGTMAILIPTAIPIAFALDGDTYGLTTMISLGAVLDGSIFGDHCSPISDTTIISSVSSSCDLIQHVRTQLPYSLFVAGLALACGYLPGAFGLAWGWSVLLALSAMIGLFMWVAKFQLPRNGR
jgi:Na+/H+ antiporter NhaC